MRLHAKKLDPPAVVPGPPYKKMLFKNVMVPKPCERQTEQPKQREERNDWTTSPAYIEWNRKDKQRSNNMRLHAKKLDSPAVVPGPPAVVPGPPYKKILFKNVMVPKSGERQTEQPKQREERND